MALVGPLTPACLAKARPAQMHGGLALVCPARPKRFGAEGGPAAPSTQLSKRFNPALRVIGRAIDARTGTRTVAHASASMAN
jgi:hypothetical protein